jgi:hypothetical protein
LTNGLPVVALWSDIHRHPHFDNVFSRTNSAPASPDSGGKPL